MILTPRPPYNFNLTMKKPAGWSLFTPYESGEKDAFPLARQP